MSIDSEVNAHLGRLKLLISTISQGGVLASTEEFDRLLNQAAQHQGTPDDIAEWADRLASDAGKLND